MNEWKKITIDDVTDVLGDGLHGTPKYTENGEYAFVNGNNLVNGKLIIKKDTKRVDETQYERYKKPLSDRTIMVSINGTLGNVGVYNGEKVILGKSACYFNVKQEYDKDFIKYVVSSPLFKRYLENNSTGTTIKNISLKQMREYEFDVPKALELQRKISSILKNIDDKIEVNEMINRNLHEQMNTLYTERFEPYVMSEDIPDGWTAVSLGDVAEVKNGCAFKGSDFTEDGTVPVIKIKNVKPYRILLNSVDYVNEDTVVGRERFKIKHGDLLITMTGNRMDGSPESWVGKVAVFDVFGNYYLNQRVGIIEPDITKISTYYLSEFLSSWPMQKYFIERATSSGGQANISPDIIKSISFAIPPKAEMEAFEELARTYYEQIAKGQDEMDKLAALRDSLIPKLMSGEIDVSDLDV